MCKDPVIKYVYNNSHEVISSYEIPCGNCLSCRLDKQILWEKRCEIEYIHSPSAFVTFTYDDYHLPYFDGCLEPTLEIDTAHRLTDNLRHKLRGKTLPHGNKSDFSYFCCGEYGDRFRRPHYHYLFFGLDYADCEYLFNSSWPYGLVKSLPILNGGIRYVVDYMCKCQTGDRAVELYDDRGRERPFYLCSKGLGSDFFLAHQEEIASTGFVKVGSRHIPVPTYYKNLCLRFDYKSLSSINHEHYKRLITDRDKAKKLNMTYFDYVTKKRKDKELSLYLQNVHKSKTIPSLDLYNSGQQINYDILLKALDIA